MKKKKLLLIIIIVVVLAAFGAIAAMMFMGGEKEEKPPEIYEFEMGEKMGNLSPEPDSSSTKAPIIKYNCVIVHYDENFTEVLLKNKTKIGNEFGKYFLSRSVSQIKRQEKVQEDLVDIVKEIVGNDEGKVLDVLFKDLTWQ